VRSRRPRLVLGHPIHAVGPLPVTGEPTNERLGRFRCVQDVLILDGDPLTRERPQALSERLPIAPALTPPARGPSRTGRAPPRGEAKTEERASCLVGREVRSIEPGELGDHLLGREPSVVHDDEVAPDRLWIESPNRPHDVAAPQDEGWPGDLDPLDRILLRHGFSPLDSLAHLLSSRATTRQSVARSRKDLVRVKQRSSCRPEAEAKPRGTEVRKDAH
jgi:hypothetical protein